MFKEFGGPRKSIQEIKDYKRHLANIKNAPKRVPNSPVKIDIERIFKISNLQADAAALGKYEEENRKMLRNINTIFRTKGKVDCEPMAYAYSSNYEERRIKNKHAERNNLKLYKTLSNVSPNYKTRETEAQSAKARRYYLMTSGKDPNLKPLKVSLDWSIVPPEISQKADPSKRVKCFFDIEAKHERRGELINMGRIHIDIYRDLAPIASENFIRLCRGDNGLTYKGTIIHKVFPGRLCLGGDIQMRKGLGGASVFGFPIPNEDPVLDFNGPGVFGTYTPEPGKNTSQFLITFTELKPLKKLFVAFGKVIFGRALEMVEEFGSKSGFPLMVMTITDCGILGPESEIEPRFGPPVIPQELVELTEKLKNEEDRERRKRLDFEEKQQFYKKYGYLTKLDPTIPYPPFPWKLPQVQNTAEVEEDHIESSKEKVESVTLPEE